MKRNAIKSITIVLALVLVCAVHTAGAVTVSIDDISSGYGTTVDIPINVSSTSNIGAADISVTYNPAVISPTGVVVNGTLISPTDLITNHTATSGIVNISVASLYGINGTGSIAAIQFSVVGSDNETSLLTLSRTDAYNLDDPTYEGDNCTGYAELDVTTGGVATFTATGEGGDWRDEWIGADSEEGTTVTTSELQGAVYHWLNDVPVRGHVMATADLQEIVALWLSE